MIRRVLSSVFVVLLSATVFAQQTANIPHVVRFGGSIVNANGTPRTGVVGVMFSLYSEQQGGTALWTELQNVALDASGQYTVLLGSQHAEGVPADLFTTNEARWLGIQVEAEPEQARVLLVSVPYALKAGDAETLGGMPLSAFVLSPNAGVGTGVSGTNTSSTQPVSASNTIMPYSISGSTGTANMVPLWIDSTTLGNSGIFQAANGFIGIGTTTPAGALDVRLTSATPAGALLSGMTLNNSTPIAGNVITAMSLVITDQSTAANLSKQILRVAYVRDAAATGGVTAFDSILTTSPTINADAPYTLVGVNMEGPTIASGKTLGTYYGLIVGAPAGGTVTNKYALITAPGAGNVGINTTTPAWPLSVGGAIQSTSGGYVFPDNTTQTTAGITGANSSAGINSSVANGLLTLSGDTAYLQRRISGTCAAGSAVATVNADGTVACQTVSGGGGSLIPPVVISANVVGGGTDPTKIGTFYAANTAVGVVNPDPSSNFPPAAIVGHASNASATGFTVGVLGRTDAPIGAGIVAMATGNGTQTDRATALTAFTTTTTGRGKALEASVNSGSSTALSVQGPSGATLIEADMGTMQGNTGTSIFHLDTSSANFSVNSFNISGQSGATSVQINGPTQVNGNLTVTGSVSKASGTFKIDHPLDPANKYLYHSFVESPDMMDVYNGVVALDARGQAWVQLPDYFEALNQDFRYQLTAIGAPGPNLYVATEVAGNRFRIAGGKPHAKVSWQVTGIRHDAYAEAHRVQVEVDKGAERGSYLHPELFGQAGGGVANADATLKAPAPVAVTPADNK